MSSEGRYMTWKDMSHNKFMTDRWARVSDVVSVIKQSHAMDLSKAANLSIIKTALAGLGSGWTDNNPFVSPMTRFPQTLTMYGALVLYVNLSDPEFALIMTKVSTLTDSGLADNASANVRRDVVSGNKAESSGKTAGTNENSAYTLTVSLAGLAQALRLEELMWTRDKFEDRFKLPWTPVQGRTSPPGQ
nr:CP [Beet necrotic yellow vein virus]